MPKVEKVLKKLREEATAKAASTGGAAAANSAEKHKFMAHRESIEAIPRPDLLERAITVTLDREALEANRVRGTESSDPGAAAYKMLRTRVLRRMRSNSWHTLAVTAPRANAGKTLTAVNLAIGMAQESNQDVILVDLDLRNPHIGAYLGLDPKFSLADYLTNDVPIEKVLLKTNIPRLYVLPGANRLAQSSEIIASRRMALLMQTLVSTSPETIVVFDMPPLLEADDMLTFMPQVDAVLFVVAQLETRKVDLQRSHELFKELNLIGTVLNKSRDESPSEYYY
jgi:Mrp family chromosome partitioning ATPase